VKLTGENRSTRGKACPSATLSTTNPTLTLGSNPGLRGERPATNCLSHGTVCNLVGYFCFSFHKYRHYGRAMAQAVSRRPLTTEARVRSQSQSMWDLWWTKWHWDRLFPEYFGFPPSISFHRCSITREKLIIFITGLKNKP
jgi:hypothetical protein